MKNKITAHSYFLIALMAVMLFLGIYALTYTRIQTKLMPAFICGLAFILAANELRKELTGDKTKRVSSEDEVEETEDGRILKGKNEFLEFVYGFLWVIGFVVGIYLVGFFISIPVFIFAYMVTHFRKWLAAFATAAIMDVLIWAIFIYALKADFFPGIFFGGF
jgi:uncharacterized protein YqhQ